MLPVFASGTLFAHIFHASPVAMTINALPGGQYIDVNASFAELVGYSRVELIGRTAVELGIVTPREREPLVNHLLADGSLGRASQTLFHRSGEPREVMVSAQLERHEGELYTVAIVQDLTDYLRTRKALRLTEARFRLFFNSVPLPVWAYDMETLRIIDANPAACAAYGYTSDELLAMTVRDVLAEPQCDENAAPPPANSNVIRKHARKDGSLMDMAISGYTLELNGQRVRLAVMRDVTQQLAAERALVDSERRLQIITALSTDGIFDCDVATGRVELNNALRSIYGAPEQAGEVAGWWLTRIHPDDRAAVLRGLQESACGPRTYWSTEFRMLRHDDRTYATVIIRGRLLRNSGGQVTRITGALVDISRQIEIAEASARAAQEERQRLARDLHDAVTQSLYSVTLLAEVARRHAQAGNAAATMEQIERLGVLSQQCLREMRLLVYELRPAMVEESGLVGALRQRLEAVEQRSGVNVQLVAGDDATIPQSLQNELFRVAEEALNNALKHAHASRLTVRLETTAEMVEMDIADNGRGFDPELAFVSGGQGLSNMRERVTRQGGEFTIDTAPGRPTTISVRVRLRGHNVEHAAIAWPPRFGQ